MARKDCPHCEGTGWRPVETDGVRRVAPCECEKSRHSESLLKSAQIPRRYEHCELVNFDIRKDSRTGQPNRSLEAAKLYSKKLVEEYPTDFGLLFAGPTGVGKTHLGVAVMRDLMKNKGIPCLYYDFLKLLKDIRDSYNPVSHTSEMRVLGPVLDVEVLMLDDLAASDPTDWVRETLAHIINSRYNEKRVTLITTTLASGNSKRREVRAPSGDPIPEMDRSLAQLGPTLASRLYEMCRIVEMKSDDYRKDIKQKGVRFQSE
ncbi:MAG TPA: ATP-binding protein [Terriglobia bacterium]|nr:ATP-binding protein [Terriglobia bacterium]